MAAHGRPLLWYPSSDAPERMPVRETCNRLLSCSTPEKDDPLTWFFSRQDKPQARPARPNNPFDTDWSEVDSDYALTPAENGSTSQACLPLRLPGLRRPALCSAEELDIGECSTSPSSSFEESNDRSTLRWAELQFQLGDFESPIDCPRSITPVTPDPGTHFSATIENVHDFNSVYSTPEPITPEPIGNPMLELYADELCSMKEVYGEQLMDGTSCSNLIFVFEP